MKAAKFDFSNAMLALFLTNLCDSQGNMVWLTSAMDRKEKLQKSKN